MILTLPIPPKALHPNARPHWAAKMTAKREYRQTVFLLALSARPAKPWAKATARAVFYTRTAHRHDPDNLNAWLKSGVDALADARYVENDRDIELLPASQQKGDPPRVELTIEESKP